MGRTNSVDIADNSVDISDKNLNSKLELTRWSPFAFFPVRNKMQCCEVNESAWRKLFRHFFVCWASTRIKPGSNHSRNRKDIFQIALIQKSFQKEGIFVLCAKAQKRKSCVSVDHSLRKRLHGLHENLHEKQATVAGCQVSGTEGSAMYRFWKDFAGGFKWWKNMGREWSELWENWENKVFSLELLKT